ncbi:carboxypeptidase-like regulatory domain-containing protein [Isoptericola sp. NPDC057391]|uniref:carboxypeptidase-like regulatory domain-containing protein n=1 Tax=Isoptericola sp. NPDC057391 TaxID=3346117 RepID=UPI00362C297E
MSQKHENAWGEPVPGEDEALDARDVAVLGRLGRAVEAVDPVPEGLVERSLFAMTLARLEAEVMELQQIEAPVGSVRGDAPPLEARTITFTHERLTVMIALSTDDDGTHVRLDGWVAPAATLVVELRQPGGERTTTADDDGRFAFTAVDRGPTSLLVRLPDGGDVTVATPVIEL